MVARFFDWIWHIKGSLALAPGQSGEEAFDRLDALFRESGTSHERTGDTLTFRKKDQAAQDKMSIFDGGVLRIETDEAGPVLRYRLASRALLFCFLAPLLFLGIAGLTVVVAKHEKAQAEATAKAEKADKKKMAEKEKKEKEQEKKDAERQMNPIDKFLGAPAPEKPKDKDKDKDKKAADAKGTDKKDAGKKDEKKKDEEEEDQGPSPTSAYVFAGIFATLYVIGRILEDRLVKSLFRKRLLGS